MGSVLGVLNFYSPPVQRLILLDGCCVQTVSSSGTFGEDLHAQQAMLLAIGINSQKTE